ncbi:competence protein ComEC [Alteromonadaceae bacterium Bs31]|nr:competence protein ComEC [Alteromonadaceae bacterium Bs31]
MLRLAAFFSFALAAGLPAILAVTREELSLLAGVSAAIAVLLLSILFVLKKTCFRVPTVLIVSALSGLALNGYQISQISSEQLPLALAGKDLRLDIEVASLVQYHSISSKRVSASFYAIVVEGATSTASQETEGHAVRRGQKIRLNWYQPPRKDLLKPGSQWALTVRLKQPRGTANPGGFDYQAWLLAQGVIATGYVRDKEGYEKTGQKIHGLDSARNGLSQSLFATAPSHALLKALLIGDKSDISQGQWQVLQKTGTIHLMAISGLHIGLIATLGFFLGRLVARLLSLYCQRGLLWIGPALAIAFAGIYAGLAGFAIPTQRALIMVVLFSLAIMQGRRLNYWHVFLWALCLVLIADPFAPLSSGFWLSFAAVAILVFCFSHRRARPSALGGMLKAQLFLLLGLAVPLSLLGLPIAGIAPLANLVAVPVVSFAIVPMLLLAASISAVSDTLGVALVSYAGSLFDYLWWVLDWLAALDLRWRVLPAKSWLMATIASIGAVLLLSPAGLRARLPGIALLLLFVFPQHKGMEARVTVLDVQQGLAVTVRSQDKTLVYDVGSRFGDFDMGSRVLAPFLLGEGVDELELVVVSHGDNDHAGGFKGLVELVPARAVISGEPERIGTGLEACKAGQAWRLGEFTVSVLWPESALSSGEKANNLSCVVLLQSKTTSILLMGDVEKTVERRLLQAGLPKDIDILLVPHHGSKTSSSVALIEHLKPAYAVFSAGYKNRYRHPNEQVLLRYERQGSEILRTDLHGAIDFSWDKNGELQVTKERISRPRPWYNAAN